MTRMKLVVYGLALLSLAMVFSDSVALSIFGTISFLIWCAVAGWATWLLPSDPQGRNWGVQFERSPRGIYHWEWTLLCDGEPYKSEPSVTYGYGRLVSGSTDTKIGGLIEAASKRREVITTEKAERKREQGPKVVTLGRGKGSTNNQQKSRSRSAQIFGPLERLGNLFLRR